MEDIGKEAVSAYKKLSIEKRAISATVATGLISKMAPKVIVLNFHSVYNCYIDMLLATLPLFWRVFSYNFLFIAQYFFIPSIC